MRERRELASERQRKRRERARERQREKERREIYSCKESEGPS